MSDPNNSLPLKFYPEIQGLRALAIILVIPFSFGESLFKNGYIGVDIFFVISGFIITSKMNELEQLDWKNLYNFYASRARKIIPPLLVTLCFNFVISIYYLNPVAFRLQSESALAAITLSSNFYFNNFSNYFDTATQNNPLHHTWSLGVEAQFYLIAPFFFLRNKSTALWLSALLFLLAITVTQTSVDFSSAFYLLPFRLFEFLSGALIYRLNFRFRFLHGWSSGLLFIIGIVILLQLLSAPIPKNSFPGLYVVPISLAVGLIVFSANNKLNSFLLQNWLMNFLGKISYCLYLVHLPIFTHMSLYRNDITAVKWYLLVSALTFFGALALQYFVEDRFVTRKPNGRKASMVYVIKFTAFAICVYSSSTFTDWWDWRLKSSEFGTRDIERYHFENWGGAGFKGGWTYETETPSNSDIVILGDSFSGMLTTGIVEEIAPKLNASVFSASGGSGGKYSSGFLLPGITSIEADQKRADWSAKNAYLEAISVLNRSNNAILIYAARWTIQSKNAAWLDSKKSLGIEPKKVTSVEDLDPIFKALERMKEQIINRQIIVIGEFPGSSKYNISNCANVLRWEVRGEGCMPEQRAALSSNGINYNKLIKQWISTRSDYIFVDPFDYFCSNGLCKNITTTGVPIYSDGIHLSKEGSRLFASYLGTIIKPLLSDPKP